MIQVKTEGTPTFFFHQPNFIPDELPRLRMWNILNQLSLENSKDILVGGVSTRGYFCEQCTVQVSKFDLTIEIDERKIHTI